MAIAHTRSGTRHCLLPRRWPRARRSRRSSPPAWSTCPRGRLYLTDGGVYDNLGVEAITKQCRTVLVSDGGGTFSEPDTPRTGFAFGTIRVLSVLDEPGAAAASPRHHRRLPVRAARRAFWAINTDPEHYTERNPDFPARRSGPGFWPPWARAWPGCHVTPAISSSTGVMRRPALPSLQRDAPDREGRRLPVSGRVGPVMTDPPPLTGGAIDAWTLGLAPDDVGPAVVALGTTRSQLSRWPAETTETRCS